MGVIGGPLGYHVLRFISSRTGSLCLRESPAGNLAGPNKSKLEKHWGHRVWDEFAGKVVIDFGCGFGTEAIEIARRGAIHVIGVDNRESVLEVARENAKKAGVSELCEFDTNANCSADVILSLDAFEHFEDPEGIMNLMRSVVKPGGKIIASFGPPWYHPYGGHLFSVFPWAHLIFTEACLIRWRSDFKCDGATRFAEVDGGLNQMTVRRFKKIVARSNLRIESLELVPIKNINLLCNMSVLVSEFFASIIRCRLVRDQKQ
ncbi:class I SAM-dependent methyltransferase [Tautonia sp. JC769]|uniref:class I SAM-dependent methyltransferase n=1 Tax=Tautonia sp. JC769 TaxID=3232135 RepID=UPI003459223F